ncbi:aminoglycoside phosphotransferase family protein [Metabacillus iocasae]|uniref:Aminoglycoside phosphotransferase (APT) family kinase protein n=1 Tax=Priestia iocasae TaxID=2291674 RepID=A0ABS2QUN2_9BACI|nr:aminoglycoside phosphotransferase family protein [Metabacillus iocasae]MBM7702903.1 aminoglycoside phosphotransferase (APT) family kinase protein [Metabacillus iocasae]
MFLRASHIQHLKKRKQEFELLKELEKQHIPAQQPLWFEAVEDIHTCFMVVTYIDGEPASETFTRLTNEKQYDIGVEAGRVLKKIHQLKAPSSVQSWGERQRTKFQRYVREYEKSSFTLQGDQPI